MLSDVIKIELPHVEKQKDDLIVTLNDSRNQLFDLQSRILSELVLSNADTILDNEVLIATLETCSVQSIVI